MTPRRYGPLPYVPITRRPKLSWPGGARVALWVNPNIEFFGLDDVMPSNLNERVPREHAKIPNVRNWAVRDYGNRVGIWRIMEVLTRYGIRASAALNSEVCDHHPEIIEEAGRLGWELIGHNQTNALRLTEMDEAAERDAVRATIDRIEAASGKRPVGWLGAGLAETWNTLDYLAEAGIRYVCDWVNDDQPYLFEIGNPPLVSLPYSVQTNDVPAYFEMKVSVPEFEAMLRRQFDTLYREGETIPRVMAIAVHPFVTGQPHRIGALDAALDYICSHAPGVWLLLGPGRGGRYWDRGSSRPRRAPLRSRQVPQLAIHLPSNAVGKDFLPGGGLLAAAPSGSGFQVSLFGLAGILIAAREGFEVNLLGLSLWVDPARPALKLPALERLGLSRP